MTRTFEIEVERVEYHTAIYRVKADSFDEAAQKYDNGYAEFWDSEYHDADDRGVDQIICVSCGFTASACTCENADVFAELGL